MRRLVARLAPRVGARALLSVGTVVAFVALVAVGAFPLLGDAGRLRLAVVRVHHLLGLVQPELREQDLVYPGAFLRYREVSCGGER